MCTGYLTLFLSETNHNTENKDSYYEERDRTLEDLQRPSDPVYIEPFDLSLFLLLSDPGTWTQHVSMLLQWDDLYRCLKYFCVLSGFSLCHSPCNIINKNK